MAWKITHDYIGAGAVGTASVEPLNDGPHYRFRLLDDDGNVYYGGICDTQHDEDDERCWESSEYGALKWGEWQAGCVNFEMKGLDAIMAGLSSVDYVEKYGKVGGWVSIFG